MKTIFAALGLSFVVWVICIGTGTGVNYPGPAYDACAPSAESYKKFERYAAHDITFEHQNGRQRNPAEIAELTQSYMQTAREFCERH